MSRAQMLASIVDREYAAKRCREAITALEKVAPLSAESARRDSFVIYELRRRADRLEESAERTRVQLQEAAA